MTSLPGEPASETPWRVTCGEPHPVLVERLLRSLPEWFAIEEAITGYVEAAGQLLTYRAWPDAGGTATEAEREPQGVLLVKRHFPWSAEIYVLAVDRAWHRRGGGRALVAAAEGDLQASGAELLQVKTLGPGRPDAAYDGTRRFYAALGFLPLEEIEGLWPGNPCLIMVKALR